MIATEEGFRFEGNVIDKGSRKKTKRSKNSSMRFGTLRITEPIIDSADTNSNLEENQYRFYKENFAECKNIFTVFFSFMHVSL